MREKTWTLTWTEESDGMVRTVHSKLDRTMKQNNHFPSTADSLTILYPASHSHSHQRSRQDPPTTQSRRYADASPTSRHGARR